MLDVLGAISLTIVVFGLAVIGPIALVTLLGRITPTGGVSWRSTVPGADIGRAKVAVDRWRRSLGAERSSHTEWSGGPSGRRCEMTFFKPADEDRTRTNDEARVVLQERLGYLGKSYALIGIGFYTAGNLAAMAFERHLERRLTDPSTWLVPAACLVYVVQWLLSRRGVLPVSALRAIDATTTSLAALFHSLMVFTSLPGEMAGMSYTRTLLLVSFGLLVRAIIVPSSATRTFLLGLPATALTVVTGSYWYAGQPVHTLSPTLHAVMTAMWVLGAVVIATLASHVIYGLRREVREARRLGQYTLIEKIGQGGMGAVYRASHAMLRRPTAVKLISGGAASPERIRRFEREVQLTSQLTHPNTVSIFDYGRTPDGVFYYAMEYLDGLTLEDLVRIDGPQPPGRVVHIMRQVASALSEAHGVGLVHRDIKPGNVILVSERGGAMDVAKVVDFGLVKEVDEAAGLTREGRIAGTPHYLSPEAIMTPAAVTPQSDLYSLGCVGYYLLTGQRVFDGRTVIEVCNEHLSKTPIPPAERLGRALPADLSAVLMSCLEKSPGDRPASAQVLIDRLDGCREAEPWTTDAARVWWNLRGPAVVARSVQEHHAAAETQEAVTVQPVPAF
jgi:serine/threonine-protein kinase